MEKFRTMFTYKPISGVVNDEVSQTVPGQGQTIKSLLERVKMGLEVPISNMEYGDDEEIIPKFTDLVDVMEAKEFIGRVQEKVKNVKVNKEKKSEDENTENSDSSEG